MTAQDKDRELSARLAHVGVTLTPAEARTLRRAERALHRWAEAECGASDAYLSWAIERDEQTGVPYRTFYPNTGKPYRHKTADRETATLKRVAALASLRGFHYYHQGDPRGAALYVSSVPLTDSNYSRGASCYVA